MKSADDTKLFCLILIGVSGKLLCSIGNSGRIGQYGQTETLSLKWRLCEGTGAHTSEVSESLSSLRKTRVSRM